MNLNRKPTRVYLAGPFFNHQQIELVKFLEETMDQFAVPYFSPRKMALNGNPTTTKPTPEQANAIFRKDYEEICKSTHLLAILDWTMPPGASLRIVKESLAPVGAKVEANGPQAYDNDQHLRPREHEVVSGHLSLPDSGTVWEMGCAYALRVPVYLYTDKPATKLNLMLTQSAVGVVYGKQKFIDFLTADMDEGRLEGWNGDHR